MTTTDAGTQRPWHILLAIEGPDSLRAATRFVSHLPLWPGSRVTAVAILTPPYPATREALSTALDQAQLLLQKRDSELRTRLLSSDPAEDWTRWVDEQRPDLVVIGAPDVPINPETLLRGGARHLLEQAREPVLIVRSPHAIFRNVLVAIDGSPQSESVVDYLARFPLPPGVEVTVVHIMLPLPDLDHLSHDRPFTKAATPPLTFDDIKLIAQQAVAEEHVARSILGRAIQILKASGITATPLLLRGDATTELLRWAQEHPVDLIAVGSHVFGADADPPAGSLQHSFVASATCSVLLVRGWAAETARSAFEKGGGGPSRRG
jgi:nucleotide-binding universal stress UspA family protein